MNTLNRITRLIAAAAAVTCTSVLFATVVSFAEPQRSTLIAKSAELQRLAVARAALHVAAAR